MKLIEAMKELKLIHKKIQDNTKKITEYSSALSSEKPIFGTEEEQRKQVNSYIQSNMDLIKRYCDLKAAIDKTNLNTVVDYNGKEYSIHELIQLKRNLASSITSTYTALNTSEADQRRSRMSNATIDGKPIESVRFYDEATKNTTIRSWQEFFSAIDSKLEIINATTDILE